MSKAMISSDVLFKSIRRFEGFRSKAYQDAKAYGPSDTDILDR